MNALVSAFLAESLGRKESMDTLPEREAETLWLDVAERRAREIDEGRVQLVTPDELERRVQARLK